VPKAERVPDFVRGHLENIESVEVTTETELPVIGGVVVHVPRCCIAIVRREITVRQNSKLTIEKVATESQIASSSSGR
jgi:hypothetical protein